MKISINDNRGNTYFDKIRIGEAFEFADEIWMRTQDVNSNNYRVEGKSSRKDINAVNLATGKFFSFNGQDRVGLLETRCFAKRMDSDFQDSIPKSIGAEESIIDKVLNWFYS